MRTVICSGIRNTVFQNSLSMAPVAPVTSVASVCLVILLLFCCGCSNLDLPPVKEISLFEKKPEFETPLQIIPVWSDTVLHQAGKRGTRGFGGRVIFYGEKKEKAIRVDGTLIVYAWDDTAEIANRQPDRKYIFKADKLQDHYSKSKIGHSYNFWLRWDAAGGEQERISLIIRFVGTNGAEVTSEPTTVILPGPIRKPDSMLAKKRKTDTRLQPTRPVDQVLEDSRLQPASHETYTNSSATGMDETQVRQTGYDSYEERESTRQSHSLQTSEIPLTSGFIERNMRGGEIGYSSDELFVPEKEEAAVPSRNAAGSLNNHNTSRNRSTQNSSIRNRSSWNNAGQDNTNRTDGRSERISGSSIRSQPFQSRVRTARATPRFHGHVRREPLPARSLNGLPQTPRSESRVAP